MPDMCEVYICTTKKPPALMAPASEVLATPALTDSASDTCKDTDQVHCTSDTGISGWWWGGLAAVGLVKTATEFNSPRDGDGHGSHTASTAGGTPTSPT